MRLIIAGSRTISHRQAYELLRERCCEMGWHGDEPGSESTVTEIVSGGCEGPDQAGEDWAIIQWIPIRLFSPNWGTHGRAAGPIRNRQMAEYADALLLIWDGKSRGSANMKAEMERLGKPVYEILTEQNEVG